jgi:hypothetical protein
MCHALEHVSRAKVPVVLSEMRRRLKAGGDLHVSVPDFVRIVDLYGEGADNIHAVHGILMGGQDHKYNLHFVALNTTPLRSLLESCGYRDVRVWWPSELPAPRLRGQGLPGLRLSWTRVPDQPQPGGDELARPDQNASPWAGDRQPQIQRRGARRVPMWARSSEARTSSQRGRASVT